VSTAQEIENAIRNLPLAEREKLLQHLPQLFPEFAGASSGNASAAMTGRVRIH
jgi:hypothetical protein